MSYQNNTIEALKKLYVAMGGDADDVENLNITPEMISAIADIYQGGGGSSLPAVTADDNGKVLAVVEGDWDKAENAGGAVLITLGEESMTAFNEVLMDFVTAAITNAGAYTVYGYATEVPEYDDIYSAVSQGKRVIVGAGNTAAEVISYSGNRVSFHNVVPFFEVENTEMSMLLDVSITPNTIIIQGFAKVNSD